MKLFILLILLFTPFKVFSDKVPVWVEKGYHPKYTEHLYIIGIGIVKGTGDEEKDIKRADDSARAEIAKQIKVHVQEEIKDVIQGSEKKVAADIEVMTKSSVDMALEGVRVVDRFFDKKNNLRYSLAVLNRENTASSLLDSVKKKIDEIKFLISEVQKLAKDGKCWAGFLNLLKSVSLINDARGQAAILKVVSASPLLSEYQNIPEIPNLSQVKMEGEKILNLMELKKLSGDSQKGETGMPLQEPFEVEVTCNGIPEGGVPLSASFRTGKGEMDKTAKTNNAGKAKFRLHTVQESGVEENTVMITLDLENLRKAYAMPGAEDILNSLESKVVYFSYTVPTKRVLRFAVLVNEVNFDQKLAVPIIKPAIEEALISRGFKIVDVKESMEIAETINYENPDAGKLAKNFSNIADVIIIGDVKTRFSSQPGYYFFFARASGVLRAVRTGDGRVIATASAEDKAAGNSKEQAGIRAIETIKDSLINRLTEMLDQAF